jgi:D-alanyl-D-alanine carboxypeptidase
MCVVIAEVQSLLTGLIRVCREARGVVAGLLLLALALAACGGGGHHTSPQATDTGSAAPAAGRDTTRVLDAELARRVRDTGVPGAAAALVAHGRLVWSGGAGMADLRTGRPMTARTPVYFASVGKTVTAAVALRLAEERRLSLDDPLRRWVPEWHGPRTVTLRRLLNHTSGVHDPEEAFFESAFLHPARRYTPSDWIAHLPPPDPHPTRNPAYDNANYILAGMAMRRAAGRDWARVRHEVAPQLTLQPDERVRGTPAQSYVYPNGAGDPRPYTDHSRYVPCTSFATAAWTAGAWAGTVQALALWANRLLGGQILQPASLHEMTAFRPGADMWGEYGLGLARRLEGAGQEVWGHTGDGAGLHAELWHLRGQGLTLVSVWNDDVIDTPALQRGLLTVALAHL